MAAVVVRGADTSGRAQAALEQAEEACLVDEDARARRRAREEARRLSSDEDLKERMTAPGPSPATPTLDPEAITLAVRASVRHGDSRYDEYLISGLDRSAARARVREEVESTLQRWRAPVP